MNLLCITKHPDGSNQRQGMELPPHNPICMLLEAELITKVTITCKNGNKREYQQEKK